MLQILLDCLRVLMNESLSFGYSVSSISLPFNDILAVFAKHSRNAFHLVFLFCLSHICSMICALRFILFLGILRFNTLQLHSMLLVWYTFVSPVYSSESVTANPCEWLMAWCRIPSQV